MCQNCLDIEESLRECVKPDDIYYFCSQLLISYTSFMVNATNRIENDEEFYIENQEHIKNLCYAHDCIAASRSIRIGPN